MAQTKRPKNKCKDCGDTWYPRGRNLSNNCPSCGSANVEISREGLLVGVLFFAILIIVGLYGDNKNTQQEHDNLTETVQLDASTLIERSEVEEVESGAEIPPEMGTEQTNPIDFISEGAEHQQETPEGNSDTKTHAAIPSDEQSSFREDFYKWSESEKQLRTRYMSLLNDSSASQSDLDGRRSDYLTFVDNKNKKCGSILSDHASNINSNVSHINFNREQIHIINCHQEANVARINEIQAQY